MPLVQTRRVVSSLPLGSSISAYTTKTTPIAARQFVLEATPSTTATTTARHIGKRRIQRPQPLTATSACQRHTMSTTRSSNPPFLIRFFHPTHASPDSQGRTLQDILHWSDRDLELSHDYIQTIFPLPEGSMFNSAPLVTPEVRDAFLDQPELAASLRGAFQRILKFYGLETSSYDGDSATWESGGLEVKRGPNFASASRNWITRFNHNHLRLTRILRSLRVLGLSEEAKSLHSFLCTDELVAGSVSSRSQMYWRRAAERELRLPPDKEDEDAQGIEWFKGQF